MAVKTKAVLKAQAQGTDFQDQVNDLVDSVAAGTQAANIAEIVITYTSNDPEIATNGAVTIADGDVPTVVELLELCEEIIAKQNAIIAALEAFGIAASS